MYRAPVWFAAASVGAIGIMLLAGQSGAGDNKELQDTIDKVAAALQKGDMAGAKKQAEAVSKKIEELYEAMDLFKPRKKGGYGVGDKPGAINPDGIEQMLIKIGRDAPAKGTLNKDSAAYEKLGYRTAALGLIALARTPPTDMGKKTRKDWMAWSDDMVKIGLQFAAAAKAKGPADVKTAAAKLNNACNSCHTVFR
ncbi:MAG: hypothetical protein L0Y71_20040 [Gemmataceae bacterium]|nr:hypothetical protein [Gemmataceae bacterium]